MLTPSGVSKLYFRGQICVGFDAFTTGNPFLGTKLLVFSIGRVLGAAKEGKLDACSCIVP